jgi:cytochrome c6
MQRPIGTILAVLAVSCTVSGGCKKETPVKTEAPQAAPASQGQAKTGEALFKQHCDVCHPNGANTIKAEKTLQGKDLTAHNITKPEDIVKIMRNPGPGMTKFDNAAVSDNDATAIADYVIKTFK